MNIWAGLALALLLTFAGKLCYDAGSDSRDQELTDANTRADGLAGNVATLQGALDDLNGKVIQFAKDQAAAEEKKKEMRKEGQLEDAKEERRGKAAETVNTSADGVLRAYWGADEQ